MKLYVLNGPNLNLLGLREPEIYGKEDYHALTQYIQTEAENLGVTVEIRQSNHEGQLVDWIQEAPTQAEGIIINPGAYTHTSIAILDALKAVNLPAVEVHLSDIAHREDFRKVSYVSQACIATIKGKGFQGYAEAMMTLIKGAQGRDFQGTSPLSGVQRQSPRRFAQRTDAFGPNIFSVLNEKKNARLAQGKAVYNLSVGTPDLPPAQHVMDAAAQAALDPACYQYSLADTPELVGAVQRWYQRRYDVALEPAEIMSVYGTQEGMAHIALALCDPGELILVPNPCYPIFEIGPNLNGAVTAYYDLRPELGYLPDLAAIDKETLSKARAMVVSYPSNPVGAVAPDSFYEELIAFAQQHEIMILHDNAYSEIAFGETLPGSFLSFPGAKDVGVEFNSLSKSYNLTGLRVSFLVGNRELIRRFGALRSQFDYGLCHIAQKAAIAALDGPQEGVAAQRQEYQRRRDALCQGLRRIGWPVTDAQGTMFVWAPLPQGYEDSEAFCMELLERTGVICTPGSSFGPLGQGHVRFALVMPPEALAQVTEIIGKSGMIQKAQG